MSTNYVYYKCDCWIKLTNSIYPVVKGDVLGTGYIQYIELSELNSTFQENTLQELSKFLDNNNIDGTKIYGVPYDWEYYANEYPQYYNRYKELIEGISSVFPNLIQNIDYNDTIYYSYMNIIDTDYVAVIQNITAISSSCYYTTFNYNTYLLEGSANIGGMNIGSNYTYITMRIPYRNTSLNVTHFILITFDKTDNRDIKVTINFTNSNWDSTYELLSSIKPSDQPSSDPFEPGGTSKPDGGGGTFDGESDPVEVPDLPTVTAAKSGLLNLFNPTIGEINSISNFLWSTDWKDWITRLGSKPLEFILGLSIVPWKPRISTAISLHLGPLDTEVVTHPLSTQYEELDFGSIDIEEYWGAVLDYSPYTSIDIFLPYIGSISLDVDEVMGKTLHCIYHCDSLSGQVVAMLKSSDAILYQFEGNAAQNIPMTATDYTRVVLAYGAVAVGLIAAGAAAAPALAEGASMASGVYTYTDAGLIEAASHGVSTAVSSLPSLSAAQVAGIGSTVAGVMSAKPKAYHTGNASGAGSQLGVQTPYIIIKRARQSLPENYNKISGYPSNIYAQVSSLSGFTVFENIKIEGIPAMESELAEIYEYMITGVIL